MRSEIPMTDKAHAIADGIKTVPAVGDVTRWLRDEATGLVTNKVYADGKGPTYTYTPDGKLATRTWARGVWKQNAYNESNLVSGTAYSGADTPSVAYTYADSGKTASATLSDGTSYTYGYDDRFLNTNESVHIGSSDYGIKRSHDEFRRALETALVVTNVRHAAKTRLYDSESRVCGYVLTNSAGRGLSVLLGYDGSYLTNMTYVLPSGGVFTTRLAREFARRNLVTRRDSFFGTQSIYRYSTEYDLLNRPTNATDSVSLVREWLYNRRAELAAASVGTNRYGYAYDTIGNRLWSAENSVTNSYVANSLNQYTSVSAGANPVYDADGNMTGDGTFAYAYDAENRLVSACPLTPFNGAFAVENRYDHRNRRIRKVVKVYQDGEWLLSTAHTFVWDGCNIVLERVESASGTTRTFEYFWGADKSGTEQGAGGVGGLLAVSVDGVFYIPCYDHNGNIVLYVSETGNIAALYVYDPYGGVVDSYGNLADVFNFGFSTKYRDRETGMIGYQRRFYSPDLGRWLNRDPIEEEGGENLYSFCVNNPILYVDVNGEFFLWDTLISSAVGGFVGGVSAALTGGDVWAGVAGGLVSGACMTICPGAAAQCGAMGGAVSGFISGIRSADKAKLCGAKWYLHVAGSVVIGTTLGKLSGKVSSEIGDGLSQAAGMFRATVTKTSKFSISLKVVGADIITGISCGVSSTAAETVFLTAPEAAMKAIDDLGNEQRETIERFDMEFDASGQFQ